MYKYTAQEQYDVCYPILRAILSGYQVSMIAELSDSVNVHYHAKIELDSFKSRSKLYNQFRKHRQFGRKSCTQLINEPMYDDYMRKSISETLSEIKDPVVFDVFEIFPLMGRHCRLFKHGSP